jgi:hypothetical protein
MKRIAIIAALAAALATSAAAQCDRQALEDDRALALLGDREALRLHLRSYCPEMPVPPGLLFGADRRRDDVGRHETTFPGRRTTSRKNEQEGRTR